MIDEIDRICTLSGVPHIEHPKGNLDLFWFVTSKSQTAFTSDMENKYPGIRQSKSDFLKTSVGKLFKKEGLQF